MVYEWDTRKARRAQILKILAAWVAAIVFASFLALLLVNAMAVGPISPAAPFIGSAAHRLGIRTGSAVERLRPPGPSSAPSAVSSMIRIPAVA
jgi:hypothetical protein